MRSWTFPVPLSPDLPEPLFLQIAQAISHDIQRGRLKAGAALPGSRTLARDLGVHRNTVLAAYRELGAEGWILSEGRTTRVTQDLPAASEPGIHSSSLPGYDLDEAWVPPRTHRQFSLAGIPDLRLFPAREFGQAIRRALRNRALLDYGDPQGNGQLREGLAGLLSEMRGLACGADQILVTGGSQMALTLIARTLIRPGDVVAIENPGYPHARSAFLEAGAQVVPVPVDAEGAEDRCPGAGRGTVRPPGRLRHAPPPVPHHRDHERRPAAPAPGMRRAPPPGRRGGRLRLRVPLRGISRHAPGQPGSARRGHLHGDAVEDPGPEASASGSSPRPSRWSTRWPPSGAAWTSTGNQVVEQAVADLLAEGILQRHVRKMRRVYAARRDALAQALKDHLHGVMDYELPSGGMSIWVRTAPRRRPGGLAGQGPAAGHRLFSRTALRLPWPAPPGPPPRVLPAGRG